MKTNEFVKKYIESQATKSKSEDALRKMEWDAGRGICELKVWPDHFNYFYFKAIIKGAEATLTIKDARSLATYLLKWSEDIEGEHEIMKEIIERQKEI